MNVKKLACLILVEKYRHAVLVGLTVSDIPSPPPPPPPLPLPLFPFTFRCLNNDRADGCCCCVLTAVRTPSKITSLVIAMPVPVAGDAAPIETTHAPALSCKSHFFVSGNSILSMQTQWSTCDKLRLPFSDDGVTRYVLGGSNVACATRTGGVIAAVSPAKASVPHNPRVAEALLSVLQNSFESPNSRPPLFPFLI